MTGERWVVTLTKEAVMANKYFNRFVFLFLMISIYGCATSDVQVRGYIEDKKRVDQNMHGNAGYLMGTPKANEPTKSTRKMFVIEVARKEEIPTGVKAKEREYQKSISPDLLKEPVRRAQKTPPSREPDIQLPSFDDVENMKMEEKNEKSFNPTSVVEYTVEKNDTLQKISKKFYDSFSKWPRIYELNKDVIKTPDRIQPGIVIKVPVE